MRDKKLILTTLIIFMFFGACAKKPESVLFNSPEQKYKVKNVKSTVSNIPSWYSKLPKDDKKVFSVGSATSPDIQLSVDMAILNAKHTLADRINGKLDGMIRSFVTNLGSNEINDTVIAEIQKVSKNVISSVDVAGYEPREIKVNASGTKYQAFVLLEYSDEIAKRVVMNRIMKNKLVYSKVNSTQAWKNLEKETQKNNIPN